MRTMLVSTTVLLTILSAVSLGIIAGYLAIWGILRLFARRHRPDPQATQVIAVAAHASGD
ncbi:MAG: hypothetical protein L0Z53_02900 [Acidobacteriales bacterium]|nr:hypothetical protein [Terriglobales bacterium]